MRRKGRMNRRTRRRSRGGSRSSSASAKTHEIKDVLRGALTEEKKKHLYEWMSNHPYPLTSIQSHLSTELSRRSILQAVPVQDLESSKDLDTFLSFVYSKKMDLQEVHTLQKLVEEMTCYVIEKIERVYDTTRREFTQMFQNPDHLKKELLNTDTRSAVKHNAISYVHWLNLRASRNPDARARVALELFYAYHLLKKREMEEIEHRKTRKYASILALQQASRLPHSNIRDIVGFLG